MNNRAIAFSFGTAAVLFSLVGVAFGGVGLAHWKSLSNQTVLSAAMELVNCRVNATTGFLSDVSTLVPSLTTSMNNFSTTLKGDQGQLQTYVNSGSIFSSRSYLKGTFDPQLNTIARSVVPDIRAANVSVNTIKALRLDYNATVGSEKSCEFSALKVIANDKIIFDQDALSAYQNVTAQIAAKGKISTASLTSIIQTANTSAVQPEIAAINSAQNVSQLRSAINAYCLFNGCPNGYNFHLAAKFDLQKLTLISQYASSNATYDNTTVLAAVNADLANASTTLSQAGTNQYMGSQSSTIWSNMGAASKLLHQLLSGRKPSTLPGGHFNGTISASSIPATTDVGGTPT